MNTANLKLYWREIVAGIAIILYIIANAQNNNDLSIYLAASRDLIAGEDIYVIKYKEWFHYYYSVLFALALYPLAILPVYMSNVLWTALNIFLLWRTWKIICSYLPLENLNHKLLQLFSIVVFVFMLRFFTNNLRYGQMTITILYLALEGIHQIHNKKNALGGSLIALGINIKLLPIALVPYLLYRGKYKATLFTLLAFLAFLVLPGVLIGFDYHFSLLQHRWNLINPANPEHLLDVSERSFHSITALLATLLVENAGNVHSMELKRNIMNINLENLELIINIARAVFVGATLYFLKAAPFKTENDRLQILYELSYILIVIPLIFPHQQQYAFYFAFPAATYLIYYCIRSFFNNEWGKPKSGYGIMTLLFLSYLLMSSTFILGEFRNYYDHYKVLTYGAFILIGLLAYCRPQRLEGTAQ